MIIDTPENVTPHLDKLKAEGVTAIIRYATPATNSDKCVKPAEASAIAKAGMLMGLVFEQWGGADNFKHDDISDQTGPKHADVALEVARSVGMPDHAAIYFAIDTDANRASITNRVLPYFAAVKIRIGGAHRIGVYGSGLVCGEVTKAGHADLGWLSNARGWRGASSYQSSAALVQLPATRVAGIPADPNNAQVEDWGAFVPSVTEEAGWTAEQIKHLQATLNTAGFNPGPIDGVLGPMTIKAFQRCMGIGVDGIAGPKTQPLLAEFIGAQDR